MSRLLCTQTVRLCTGCHVQGGYKSSPCGQIPWPLVIGFLCSGSWGVRGTSLAVSVFLLAPAFVMQKANTRSESCDSVRKETKPRSCWVLFGRRLFKHRCSKFAVVSSMLQLLLEFCKASCVIAFFLLKQLVHKVLTTFQVCSFEMDILPNLIAHRSFLITSRCYLAVGLCMCKSTWRTCPTHAQHMELRLGNFCHCLLYSRTHGFPVSVESEHQVELFIHLGGVYGSSVV